MPNLVTTLWELIQAAVLQRTLYSDCTNSKCTGALTCANGHIPHAALSLSLSVSLSLCLSLSLSLCLSLSLSLSLSHAALTLQRLSHELFRVRRARGT